MTSKEVIEKLKQGKRVIYKCYVGSIAHNLYLPKSMDEEFGTCDKDFMEFFVYDKDYYSGLHGYYRLGSTYNEFIKDDDIVSHEIRKAVDLLAKGNPNLLVTLFNHPDNFIEMTTGGKILLENKDKFLSANNVKKRFVGYAYSQLHKMTNNAFRGYMGKKRKEIVEQHGYDTKNAMTLVRLLLEGIELLETGNLNIYHEGEERELLLDIKRAKFSLQEVKEMSEELFAKLDSAYEKTELRKEVDREGINKVLIKILDLEVFT